MKSKIGILVLLVSACASATDSGWTALFNGRNLDGWEVVGDGLWTVMGDGTLLGQRDERNSSHQSWLYTVKDFGEFDLELQYWTRIGGNSGISIRDNTRARWSHGEQWDRERTPSHNGYEIQISNSRKPGKWATGSIYLFAPAKENVVNPFEWNTLEIQSRRDVIRVKVNGELVTEHPGEPGRPKVGPIGLQLHDPRSVVMFRNIRIRETR
jgi:hypothetical protein